MIDRAEPPLARLAEAHYDELLAFVRRRVGSAALAMEIVQETWLRAAADPDRPVADGRAYLYRIAANLAVDRLRRERLESAYSVPGPPPPDIAADAPSPERAAVGRQELAVLEAAIAELPERCREVFLLHRADGLTMRAIAARLAISEKTVEKHIARALLHCRQRLAAARRGS
ncbi:MAG: RNA polymerase sigma factor [Alphaproteobacteria bacterium]